MNIQEINLLTIYTGETHFDYMPKQYGFNLLSFVELNYKLENVTRSLIALSWDKDKVYFSLFYINFF